MNATPNDMSELRNFKCQKYFFGRSNHNIANMRDLTRKQAMILGIVVLLGLTLWAVIRFRGFSRNMDLMN